MSLKNLKIGDLDHDLYKVKLAFKLPTFLLLTFKIDHLNVSDAFENHSDLDLRGQIDLETNILCFL